MDFFWIGGKNIQAYLIHENVTFENQSTVDRVNNIERLSQFQQR